LTIAIDKLIKIYNDYDINDLLTEGTCSLIGPFDILEIFSATILFLNFCFGIKPI